MIDLSFTSLIQLRIEFSCKPSEPLSGGTSKEFSLFIDSSYNYLAPFLTSFFFLVALLKVAERILLRPTKYIIESPV